MQMSRATEPSYSEYDQICDLMSWYASERSITFEVDRQYGYLPQLTYKDGYGFTFYITASIASATGLAVGAEDRSAGRYMYAISGHAVSPNMMGPIGKIDCGVLERDIQRDWFMAIIDDCRARISLGVDLYRSLGPVYYFVNSVRRGV